jgi:hypothetical protein
MSTLTPRRTPRRRSSTKGKATPKTILSPSNENNANMPPAAGAKAKTRKLRLIKDTLTSARPTTVTATLPSTSGTSELQQSRLKNMYSLVRRRAGKLGGGGAGGAIYGELTFKSFSRVVEFLKSECNLTSSSTFIDIGAGLGKPNLHVALDPGVKASVGVELGGERWWQSMDILWHGLEESTAAATGLDSLNGPVFLAHADFLNMDSLEAFSHVYMFDKGFPPVLMEHIAVVFNSSRKSDYLICYKKPRIIVDKYAFDVEEVGRVRTSMSGSGEGNTCFVYRKLATASRDEDNFKNKKNKKNKKKTPSKQQAQEATDFVIEWTVPPPPEDPAVAAPVCHGKSYGQEGMTLAVSGSMEKYRAWVFDQIGASRAKRRLRTRRKKVQ